MCTFALGRTVPLTESNSLTATATATAAHEAKQSAHGRWTVESDAETNNWLFLLVVAMPAPSSVLAPSN